MSLTFLLEVRFKDILERVGIVLCCLASCWKQGVDLRGTVVVYRTVAHLISVFQIKLNFV